MPQLFLKFRLAALGANRPFAWLESAPLHATMLDFYSSPGLEFHEERCLVHKRLAGPFFSAPVSMCLAVCYNHLMLC